MLILERFAGIGDALFVNTVAYYYGLENNQKVWIGTNFPEIFYNNPYVKILPFHKKKNFDSFLRWLNYFKIKYRSMFMGYVNADNKMGNKHIFEVLASKLNLKTTISQPKIFLSQKEYKKSFFKKTNDKKWIAIQSEGLNYWTANRNYFPERYQELSNMLIKDFNIIHIGLKDDAPINCSIDLRGKLKIREIFALFKQVDLFVGQVGFLMHSASTMNCRSVIIYGGFEAPFQSGYAKNINLYSNISCAPCWELICPYDKKCMQMISVETIYQSIIDSISSPKEV